MCGILGIYTPDSSLPNETVDILQNALMKQKHRGPDADGYWLNEKVALGHNRLSIIDLTHAADQPFYREDLGLRISFNGEIYNYQILKEELLKKDYHFKTNSDTEVLLAGYHAFGSEICRKITGMYAFAIWDENKDSLFLARDRFGEKPLFYIKKDSGFYFASELNALRTIYPGELNINQDAVVDLLEMMYIHLHHTIYKEVSNFPPAHWLKIDSKGEFEWGKYYSYSLPEKEKIDFLELKKLTKEKLFKVVEKQLHADVPVATFLSAGVDSGLITAIASEIKPDLTAVTMSTAEESTDETAGATFLAKKLGINHEIVPVSTDSIDHLSNILSDIQPLADASLIPSHLVTNKVQGKYKVMLSGDGGDEIFGSYNRPNLYQKYSGGLFPLGDKIVQRGLSFSGKNSEKLRSRLNDKNRMKFGGWGGFFSSHNLNSGLMGKVFLQGKPQNNQVKLYNELKERFSGNEDKLSFGIDFESRLPGDFLFKIDSAAMHSSIEVRAPFLDHQLVDFLMKVPVRSLMPNGIDKELSKSLLSDYTGKPWEAPKKGFTIPYWKYLQGDWGDILEVYLREGKSQEYFSFNTKGLLDMLHELRKQHAIHYGRILFAVLVMEIWLRVFHLASQKRSAFYTELS
ncbi:asparagine synthase (glutamine-hydrolyzing) [Algoriphagus sediminis]|uniref:asparagine synthase (glutamine-hydrolyzing) n=1 Tax=Algoriphagus sediminis TaxID=3057113 RepID=A0ABT7YE49_9BACT|nr:asparagine synthase (glutamine-hydrolyzing) [Algoriphagus sediminis]MDN3204746.1 asparagine synthase (glutamine-hydrolyzing) [Algoriphagus sediminis]